MAPGQAPPAAGEIECDHGDDQFMPVDHDIVATPVDYPLELLHQRMAGREIVMPGFQRQYVWDRPRASRLIESFIMGLLVPPVFVSEQRDRTQLVIDGRQRLETVHRFFKEEFEDAANGKRAEKFRLIGVNPGGRLHNKSFSALDPADQRLLRNTLLRVIVMRQMDPDGNPTVMHHVFERLNTARIQPGDQEARGRIYAGRLNDLIVKLNGLGEWRRLIGMPRRDERQGDAELILRYMALRHNLGGYKRPMKDFLSSYMYSNRDPPDEFVCEERARFAQACAVLLEALEGEALGQSGRVNPSVLDALLVTVAGSPGFFGGGGLAGRVRRLRSDAEFIESTTRSTTDPAAVFKRMRLAREALRGR